MRRVREWERREEVTSPREMTTRRGTRAVAGVRLRGERLILEVALGEHFRAAPDFVFPYASISAKVGFECTTSKVSCHAVWGPRRDNRNPLARWAASASSSHRPVPQLLRHTCRPFGVLRIGVLRRANISRALEGNDETRNELRMQTK